MSRTLAVDAHSLMFRAFFASQRIDGSPGASMRAVLIMLAGAIRRVDPHYVIAARDLSEPTFRHKLDGQYKASREPTPPELREFIPMALQQLQAIGIPVIESPGFEADDILATLAYKLKSNHRLFVLSSDRDLVGLVRPGVDLLLMQSGGKQKLVGYENAHELFGVSPDLVAEYKALVGDSSDNIPGVQGIGPKTALQLLERYGGLEAIIEAREDLSGKASVLKDEEAVRSARLCHRLAELNTQAPFDFSAAQGLWTGEKLAALKSAMGLG